MCLLLFFKFLYTANKNELQSTSTVACSINYLPDIKSFLFYHFTGASLFSGAAAAGMPPTDTACLLLPDGTLQPLAQALPTRHVREEKVLPRPPPFPSPQVSIISIIIFPEDKDF